jgi:hypothetical protein
MIIAEQKPLKEIRDMIAPYNKVLVAGCGACVTICLSGGEKEVGVLSSTLRLADAVDGKEGTQYLEQTVTRQCEDEFIELMRENIGKVDAVLSLACGVCVQDVAAMFPGVPVLPGLNTTSFGRPSEQGVWVEECAGCGDCVLDETGGVCPIARCAKSLLNGPCGGSHDGKCEVSDDTLCAWALIWERLGKLQKSRLMEEVKPAKDWSTAGHGGPRKMVREDLRK